MGQIIVTRIPLFARATTPHPPPRLPTKIDRTMTKAKTTSARPSNLKSQKPISKGNNKNGTTSRGSSPVVNKKKTTKGKPIVIKDSLYDNGASALIRRVAGNNIRTEYDAKNLVSQIIRSLTDTLADLMYEQITSAKNSTLKAKHIEDALASLLKVREDIFFCGGEAAYNKTRSGKFYAFCQRAIRERMEAFQTFQSNNSSSANGKTSSGGGAGTTGGNQSDSDDSENNEALQITTEEELNEPSGDEDESSSSDDKNNNNNNGGGGDSDIDDEDTLINGNDLKDNSDDDDDEKMAESEAF